MDKKLIDLGKLFISDFLRPGQKQEYEPQELALVMDEDGAAHLTKHVPVNLMFGKYWYRSGTNNSMRKSLKNVVDSILEVTHVKEGVWLDIASNDGTLLSLIPKSFWRIGIDPCEDSFLTEARKHGYIVQDYFTKEAYPIPEKADIITSIAMFYDVSKRDKFLEDLKYCLKDDGIWVLQLSYTPLMINQLAFDNICHEHYYYYSLFNLKKVLEKAGFKVMDCTLNEVNGGSFRLFVMKYGANEDKFASQPVRDVCKVRVESLVKWELSQGLDCFNTWNDFYNKIEDLKKEVVTFLRTEKAKGKTIWGYGASTKGNTLLQYFGIDYTLLTAIADRSEYKKGTYTVGTCIPITDEEEMRKTQPDYLLILPWHFITEFKERENQYLLKGGKFIVPCPKLKIIKAEGKEIEMNVYSHTMQETGPEIEAYIEKLKG